MLDMGFLPDIRRVLRHIPPKRQTLFFSATMPRADRGAVARDAAATRRRSTSSGRSAPAVGITQAVYPVPQDLKAALLLELLQARRHAATRWSSRAPSTAPTGWREYLERARHQACERIHGNRSQAQRTEALAGFKSGKYRVLVATDIAARGIDVEALGHVVNFDVPAAPEDYIHRVGRTGARRADRRRRSRSSRRRRRASLRAIERAIGKRLPRVTLPDFDYQARPQAPPLDQRPPRPQGRQGQSRRPAHGRAARRCSGARRGRHVGSTPRPGQQRRSWSAAPRRRRP